MAPSTSSEFTLPRTSSARSQRDPVDRPCPVYRHTVRRVLRPSSDRRASHGGRVSGGPQGREYVRRNRLSRRPARIRRSSVSLGLKQPEPPIETLAGGGPWRINVGGSDEFVDAMGRTWMADRGAIWGLPVPMPDAVVSGTDVPELYRSARVLARGYRFHLPNGTYEVRIHAAETFGLYAAASVRGP